MTNDKLAAIVAASKRIAAWERAIQKIDEMTPEFCGLFLNGARTEYGNAEAVIAPQAPWDTYKAELRAWAEQHKAQAEREFEAM